MVSSYALEVVIFVNRIFLHLARIYLRELASSKYYVIFDFVLCMRWAVRVSYEMESSQDARVLLKGSEET